MSYAKYFFIGKLVNLVDNVQYNQIIVFTLYKPF